MPHRRSCILIIRSGFTMYYCLWTTVHVFLSSMSEIKVSINIYIYLTIIELAMYVSHVLDRKLLERLMSPSPESQVMFASAFS